MQLILHFHRTPSKKASFWKPSHDDEGLPQVCILFTLHYYNSFESWKANLRKAQTYVTQSIRTTHTMQNVQTSRTIETHQTAPPVRKGLIDIVSDEPRPEIVLVVHMHGYQPLAVGDRNLQHANPFAFIHEITMRDAIYLTLGVPAETDIDIKRLVDKCRVLIDEADKLEDIYEISDADIYRHEAVVMKKYRAEQREKERREKESKELEKLGLPLL